MADNSENRKDNIICGRNSVLEAVRSGREIDRLLVAHGVSGGSIAADGGSQVCRGMQL